MAPLRSLCAHFAVVPLFLVSTGHGLAAQDCSFSNDQMDDLQRIRSCMERVGTDGWTNPNGFTVLHRAARHSSNPTVVSVILRTGFDPNAKDDDGRTPLHHAAYNRNPMVLSTLLDGGARPNVRDNEGVTPLHRAVGQGNRAIVAILLGAGADPNAITYNDEAWTPLHYAADGGDPLLVSDLLDNGADPARRSAVGWPPLNLGVVSADEQAVVSALLQGGAGADLTALHIAALNGDPAA